MPRLELLPLFRKGAWIWMGLSCDSRRDKLLLSPGPRWLKRAPVRLRPSNQLQAKRCPGSLGSWPHRRQSWAPECWLDFRGSRVFWVPGTAAAWEDSKRCALQLERALCSWGPPSSLAHPSLPQMPLPFSSPQPGLAVGSRGTTHSDRAPAACDLLQRVSLARFATPFP